MAVKHVPTNEVHSGNKGGTTGCGFDTRVNPTHWVSTTERITCAKNGCKNTIKSIQIQLSTFNVVHYRGLDGLSLPRLGRVNLITGKNGVGKSALMEAMWLFVGRYYPNLLWNANVLRVATSVVDPIACLSQGTIELHGTENGSLHKLKSTFDVLQRQVRLAPKEGTEELVQAIPAVGQLNTWLDTIRIDEKLVGMHQTPRGFVVHERFSPPVPRPASAIDTASGTKNPEEIMQRFSQMVRQDQKRNLLDAVNMVMPGIADIEILSDELGDTSLSVSMGNGTRLALADLGGGFVRLFGIYLSFFAARGGVVLIDEIENGIHYSVLSELWNRMGSWSEEWGVQVFATTHSGECIEAAVAAFAEDAEDLCVHKLFVNAQSTKTDVVTFTGETLEGARDLSLEMR